jgi:predicted phage terminase large subunit-like protein
LYEPSKRRVSFEGGAIATLFSSEEALRLRGPQHDLLWLDELAAFKNAREVWDTAMLGLRLGKRPRAIVTTTPKPVPLIRDLLKREGRDVSVTRARTVDNAENLAASFLSEIAGRYSGTRLGRQELDGELLADVENALWSRDLIEQCRVDKPPALKRVVIAVDPAVSVSEASDETGIIVVGLSTNGEAYVLEDASGRMSPVDWARKAVSLYRVHAADRIVAEANQGGAMVETTIRTVDANVSLKLVNASRGKITRAEPISSLFEQRRAHLVGTFPELEDQMATYVAGSSGSPDRLDAMVWGLHELMIQTNGADQWIEWAKNLALSAPASPLAIEPLPWRDGLKALPPPRGAELPALTKLYLDTQAEAMRAVEGSPNICGHCGGAIAEGEAKRSDGFESWHVRCCPNA